jgi:DNA repair exonuclease SbcCD ATPase subunit
MRDQTTFDLDASAVLFWGPNGTGKTTLFDALLWLLQGSLPRLANHTMRRNEEYVVNTYRRGLLASVTAELRARGDVFRITRRGNTRASTLEISSEGGLTTGPASDQELQRILVGGQLLLSEMLATSGLLQQDDLRLLLRDKPDQRYRQLLRLLGLEVLEQFERSARSWQADARTSTKQALAALDRQRAKASDLAEQVETIRLLGERSAIDFVESAALESAITDAEQIVVTRPVPRSSKALAAFRAEAADASRRVEAALRALESVPVVVDEMTADESDLEAELDMAESRLRDAQDGVASALETRSAVQQMHDALNSLAALAIPLLQGGERDDEGHVACPVCRTRIDPERVVADLTSRASAGATLADAESTFAHARALEVAARDRLEEVNSRLQAANAQRKRIQRAADAALGFYQEFSALAAGETIRIKGIWAPDLSEDPRTVLRWVVANRIQIASFLQGVARSLSTLTVAANFATERAQAAQESVQRTSQLPRFEAQLLAANTGVQERQTEYDAARRAETVASALVESATVGIEEIFRGRFESIEPLMNDIYGRLDPHPAFTKLDFRVETYRSRGTATATVTDELQDIQANPSLVFSSAQTNIVVLSAFLALGWAAGEGGLPFVLMDDPLQSFDDVNVLGFADLMRQLRRQRQLLLSTHEERFARVLERKLMGRREGETLIVHRFLSWSREGPQFETRRFEGDAAQLLRVLAS